VRCVVTMRWLMISAFAMSRSVAAGGQDPSTRWYRSWSMLARHMAQRNATSWCAAMPETEPRARYRMQRKTIGTITPSGNIVVERMTTAILADFPVVSGHFSRIEVVGSTDPNNDDYDWGGMMRAADLLSHADPDVICWNGSKGGSIGLDADRRLCERITEATGKPATTSSLAILEAFATTGVRRFGLVTPYASGYASRIPPHFHAQGYACVAQAHAGLSDNLSYCTIADADIAAMVWTVSAERPDAIILYCTNFPGAHLVAELEAETGVPVYDSVSVCVWKCLRLIGEPTLPGSRWGSLFTDRRFA
jgi:maleate isomerase